MLKLVTKRNNMKVTTKLQTISEDSGSKSVDIEVLSHKTYSDRIIIKIEDKEYIVYASNFSKAISNAINHDNDYISKN